MDLIKYRQFAERKSHEYQGPSAMQMLGGPSLTEDEYRRLSDASESADELARIGIFRTFSDVGKYAAVQDLLNPGNPLFINHRDSIIAAVQAVMGQDFDNDPTVER